MCLLFVDKFRLSNGLCIDISAGCNGFINAFDLARSYLAMGKKKYLLVVGVDLLSKVVEEKDYALKMLLADGAGAILLGRTEEEKMYQSFIESKVEGAEYLTYSYGDVIHMDGLAIYKYAVTEGSRMIKEILKKEKVSLEELRSIVPHQSNQKIIEAMANRLKVEKEKFYFNIQNIGNTFCASIPIALDEMEKKEFCQSGDKILLVGYGGGLNTGCILMER